MPEREHILSKDCWCGPRVDAYGDDKAPEQEDEATDAEG